VSTPSESPAPAVVPPVVAITGNPTEEEIAAVITVLAAVPNGADEAPRRGPSRWSHPAALVRAASSTRPGSWSGSWQRR
jgi:hypothetical protein